LPAQGNREGKTLSSKAFVFQMRKARSREVAYARELRK
jgi:hypothetical protein